VMLGAFKIAGDWSPNGGTYNLTAGQIYVFDMSVANTRVATDRLKNRTGAGLARHRFFI